MNSHDPGIDQHMGCKGLDTLSRDVADTTLALHIQYRRL